jgi:hypothetical protein
LPLALVLPARAAYVPPPLLRRVAVSSCEAARCAGAAAVLNISPRGAAEVPPRDPRPRRNGEHTPQQQTAAGPPERRVASVPLPPASDGFVFGRQSVEAVLAALRNGSIVLLLEDAEETTRASLVASAAHVSTEQLQFLLEHTVRLQAALDALELLLQEYRFTASEVERIVVALPRAAAPVVDNRAMPAVNLQHQLSLMLLDGDVTFHSTHDMQRFNDDDLCDLRRRISIDPQDSAEFESHPRQAVVHVHLVDSRVLTQRVKHVRGTPENPMSSTEVVHKAVDLMEPILGVQRAQALADRVLDLEHVANARELDRLLIPNSVHA